MINPAEINVAHLFVCSGPCQEVLNRAETEDPATIEGNIYCDSCASDLVSLRLEGYLKPIKQRTEKVVDAHNRKLDADLADMIYPINSIRHI